MAEDHDRPRKDKAGRTPWLKLFSAFNVALDPRKLLLAGLGVLLTSLGWWLLSVLFYSLNRTPTALGDYIANTAEEKTGEDYKRFRRDRQRWNFLHALAGPRDSDVRVDVGDLAA